MLSDGSTAAERQALIHRPFQPQKSAVRTCIERCLFVASDGQLLFMLFALFILSLVTSHTLNAWFESLVLTLKADVLLAFLLVTSLMCVVLCIMSFALERCKDVDEFLANLVWLFVSLMLMWYSMLKICELHKLEVKCWHKEYCRHHPKDKDKPEIEGLENVLLCWAWLPMGLFEVLLATLWRPAWFLLYVLPLRAIGEGPFNSMPWCHWREIIVGCVLWPFMIVLSMVATAIEEDRRRVVVLSFIFAIVFAAVPFYLTSAPVMGFWAFLTRPWSKLLYWGFRYKEKDLQMPPEESGALIVMIWWLARILYVMASLRMEEFNAHKRVEEALHFALEHPFHADLEQGFANVRTISTATSPATSTVNSPITGTATPGNSSSWRRHGVGTTAEAARSLEAKRQQLILAVQDNPSVLPRRLMLRARRSRLLEDTWQAMVEKPVVELLAPGMEVSFEDEIGSDAGGLTRDWFNAVASRLVEGSEEAHGSSLFATAPDGTLVPRPVRSDESSHEKFKALLAAGRFLALAVYREQSLPVAFGLITCKHILGVAVGMDDVRQLDPEFYRGRVEAVLKKGGLAELNAALGEPLVFLSAASAVRPNPEPLKNGGADIQVTEDNKVEYVQLLCEAYLCSGIRREIQSLLQGFYAILPFEALRHCRVTPRELSILISGVATLDPDDWCSNSLAGDLEVAPAAIQAVHSWFWEVVRELEAEQRCMLLHFVTGSSRLPPGGFASLAPPFNITVNPGSCERLPVAHTCANNLVLQEYDSKAQLKEKLLMALTTDTFELV